MLMSDSGTLTSSSYSCLDDFIRKRRKDLISFRVFSCKGIVKAGCNLCEVGYLRSGHFNRLLRNELYDFDSDDEYCECFGMTVVRSAIINKFESIIHMAKKDITIMRNINQEESVNSICGGLNLSECFQIRKRFCSFFNHVKAFIIKLTDYELDFSTFNQINKLTVLLNEWRGLLLFLGRLSDLPEHIINSGISSNGNASTSKFYHLFHLYLDIWWSTIELLYIIDIAVLKNNLNLTVDFSRPLLPGCEGFFSQVILLFLWDLCFLAVKCHNNLSTDYQTATPFMCTCIYEIWIMIIHILEYRTKQESKYFWNYMHYLFQRILGLLPSTLSEKDNTENPSDLFILEPESFNSSNPIGFCMWLLTHVTSLYDYDSTGNYISDIKIQRNYSNIQSLISMSLSSQLEKNDEAQLRCILCCCHMMCNKWETNMDAILPIIDFFLKKIESFQLKFGIQLMAFTNKSNHLWLEEIKEISLNREKIKLFDTNFQIFLRLLSLQLSKIDNDKNNFWKQIKGRIYTKFHSRRMKELSEIGLFNSFTLFLVLAHTTDLLDIGSRLCNLTTLIHKGNMGSNKQMISWNAAFTLIAVYQERNIDISTITNNICDQFNQVCINFSQNEIRLTYTVLINTYLEGVQNIIRNSSSLTHSECLLLEKGLDILLSKRCEDSHSPLLTMIEQLLKKLYSIFEINKHSDIFNSLQLHIHDHHIKLLQVLYNYILPFLRSHVIITSMPLSQCAFISSMLTYFSLFLKVPDLNDKLVFSELFNYFGSNFKINANVTCDYLCILLKEKGIINYLTKKNCIAITKSWFRCCLCIIPPSKKMQELTQLLISLPEPANLLKHIDYNGQKHDDIIISFCYKFLIFSMEEKLSLASTLQYVLQDFVLSLPEMLKKINTVSKEMLSHTYNLCSHLIEYCAPHLYIKSKPDCILISLIDAIIFPHVIYFKNKEVPSVLFELIGEHMTSFVNGLTKINFYSDPYIKCKLKDIIIQYLPRFLVKSRENNFNIHPLLKSISQLPDTIANDFIIFATEIIKNNFIKKGSSHFQHFSLSISFFNELLNRINPTYKQNLISKLLPFLLDHLLLNKDHIMNQLKEFILNLLKICETELEFDFRKNFLLPCMQRFIKNHLLWKANHIFRLMQDITKSYPKLSIDLIPILIKQIQVIEESRGVGKDQNLRHGLLSITNMLW